MLPQPKVLLGHTSEQTAYTVNDYPYGFQKRCKIRFWVETGPKGQRVCSQTTNPDKPGEVWNKVKRTNYTQIRVLYLDANTGHVKDADLSMHATKKEVDAFLDKYGADNFTDDYTSKTLELMKKYRQLMMQRFANDPSIVQVGMPEESK
jgi:uncharacterized protein YeeX (DUF496 family)